MDFFAGWCFGVITGFILVMTIFHFYEKRAAKNGWINLAGTIYTLEKTNIKS